MSGILKISSGAFRGLKLKAPESSATRPSRSMVRESFFNMIQTNVPGAIFWDLFAGTGAMGLEALSRGCEGAIFFECAHQALSCLKQNITLVAEKCEKQGLKKYPMQVVKVPINKIKDFRPFQAPDIVFADPPYKAIELIGTIATKLDALNSPFDFIVESDLNADDDKLRKWGIPETWRFIKAKKYGQTQIHWYNKEI